MNNSPAFKFKLDCQEEVEQQGHDETLKSLTADWFIKANAHKYSYHFEWLGRPIIQYPQDIYYELFLSNLEWLILEVISMSPKKSCFEY